ncbi:hypothetical protein RB653_008135 [Dictyostelium firmibasis]|uniref:Signal peptide peptidase family protein n=1 Tax=Dictyostelium firmibasis TaxID=79012 RepID=A0AAN7YP23_9MYCE
MGKWLMLIDPASFLIIGIPVFAIWYGSYRSYRFNIENQLLIMDNNDMPNKWLLILPCIGSLSLLTFFYYMDAMYNILICVIVITSLLAISYVTYPLFQYLLPKFSIHDSSKKLKMLDDEVTITLSSVIAFVCGVILTLFWYYSNHYIFVNFLSICSCITAFSFMRLNNLRGLTMLLWTFLIYDVFWVFYSSYFFGESVMEKVAVKVLDKFYLPMLISVPKFFGGGFSSLGNGDIVLPGIYMCQLYFLDKYYRFGEKNNGINNFGYFKISVIGYISGLIISLFAVLITESGQPALLYLVPTVTLPTIFFAHKCGHLSILMKPIPKPKQDQESLINS